MLEHALYRCVLNIRSFLCGYRINSGSGAAGLSVAYHCVVGRRLYRSLSF